MNDKQRKEQRTTAYIPPYVKEKMNEYVRSREMSVSEFVGDAVRDKLRQVGVMKDVKRN